MVFQCIFGQNSAIGAISTGVQILDITIFWDKEQMETMHPKFTLYRFGSGFTIATNQFEKNIAFDIVSIFSDDVKYEMEINIWRTVNSSMIFHSLTDRFESMQYDQSEDMKSFRDEILAGREFFTLAGYNIITLPMAVGYNPHATTPIVELIKSSKHREDFTGVSVGMVLNRILEDNFTLIQEIYPTRKELSNSLAALRNKHQDTYSKLLDAFKQISGGVGVLVEQDSSNTEQILFVEQGVCPRDIYPRMTKDMDRQITASPNDYKETRSTTIRFGSAVPVWSHAEYRAGNNQGAWESVRRQARPGRHDCISAWRHGSCLHHA